MAHIRLEAALETSNKWQITDASLLRWRKKLKHVAEECDDMLHKFKQRIHEDEQVEQELMNSSLHSRIARATKSFIFSAFSDKNEPSRSMVQSLQLKPSRKSSLSFLHRTSHGCHMLIYGTENTGTISTASARTQWFRPDPLCCKKQVKQQGSRKRKLEVQQDQVQVLGSWNRKVACFLNSWVAHAPVRLRGLILTGFREGRKVS
ncbi:unnamed protein product [Miscanthus lutarioriparius]|uniref:Rx N-terminal domain-containing protein n=1 Tax=Miscanthus lutarioriparius TaxID=422564 RepID=A0A811NAG6_9POAL|nr:unnamed protein product [Miscanthus lutarioriparius]